MAATNLGCTWKFNLFGRNAPFKFPLNFSAGSSQAIKSGEILDLSGANPVPLASDKAMTNIIAIADAESRDGDKAGYRMAIIPTPGDVFEYTLASAAAPSPGDSLYFSDSQTVATSGTHALGNVLDESTIPLQGFDSVNPSYAAGTTLRTVSKIRMTFKAGASYW